MLRCEAEPEGSEERARLKARLVHMVNLGIECSLSQLLETGIMHADPHPGNLILTPDDRLVYLDFGLLTYVPAQSCQVPPLFCLQADLCDSTDLFCLMRLPAVPLQTTALQPLEKGLLLPIPGRLQSTIFAMQRHKARARVSE